MNDRIDYSRLDPELVKRLEKIRAQRPENMAIQVLQEIQSVVEMIHTATRDDKTREERTADEVKALIKGIQSSLEAIKDKESPETPDFAQPVVEALSGLEKALQKSIKALDVKPQVNVEAPQVKVDAPKVDLSGVEKVLKEMPKTLDKAFEKAVKSIPTVEIPKQVDYTEFYKTMIEWLESIDTASRLKPESVGAKILNPTDIATAIDSNTSESSKYGIQAVSDDGTYKYFFFESDDTNYYVMRKHKTTKVFSYTKGNGSYTTIYQNETSGPNNSPTWKTRGSIF